MEKSIEFLEKLLECPSPSGDERAIQKIWYEEVKKYSDEIKTDVVGNVIATKNPGQEISILLAGHCDEIAFMVTYIDSDGFLYVTKSGGINPQISLGMTVDVYTKGGIIKGVVGVKAQHQGGPKEKIKCEDIYIDIGAKSADEAKEIVSIGDYILYNIKHSYLKNDLIAGKALDDKTGAFIVAEVLKRLENEEINVTLHCVSTVSEETTANGAFFASKALKPTIGIACDVTFANDNSGINKKKYGDISLGDGPVLAKGAPINNTINELIQESAKKLDINLQYEITARGTGTDADKIKLGGEGVPVALLSLPLRYMHSPNEVASLKDIENEIILLVDFIKNIKKDQSFKLF